MSVLEIQRLTVRYGGVDAVTDLDLELHEGEVLGLLGPNGAGKTSTLAAVEGLVRPARGRVVVAGMDATRHPREARRRLGVQLQTTTFQPDLTLLELLRLYAALYGAPLRRAEALARLEHAELGAHARSSPARLSGGQRQRFALLVALVHEPAVVLLDEPTLALDPHARRSLWRDLDASRRDGRGIVLTTHGMEEAAAVCDRIAILVRGRLAALGTPAGLIEAHRADPAVRRAARGEVTLEDVFVGLTGTEAAA